MDIKDRNGGKFPRNPRKPGPDDRLLAGPGELIGHMVYLTLPEHFRLKGQTTTIDDLWRRLQDQIKTIPPQDRKAAYQKSKSFFQR